MITFSGIFSEPHTYLIGLAALFLLIGCAYTIYTFFQRWQRGRSIARSKSITVGLPSSDDFLLPGEIGKAFNGFMTDVMVEMGQRLGRRVEMKVVAPDQCEQVLNNKQVDLFVLDGSISPVMAGKIDTVSCHTTALSSLALVFWDKMPYHVQSLQDFACYPYNSTVVVGDSLEEHYLATFDSIRTHRVDSVTDIIVQLKLGLVRAGLMRIEHVHCLKREYGNLKYMPVSLQKNCVIQDEKIGVARGNQDLLIDVEHTLSKMRCDGTIRQLHEQWFGQAGC